MRFSGSILRVTCFFLISSVAPFAAETSDTPSPIPKTVAIAAFKNGLAFVLRQGEVPLSSGVGRITPIPNATLGSLWISPNTPGSKLDEVVAYRYNIAGERTIPSLGEILRANVGKTITVSYQTKDYTGEVVGLRDSAQESAEPSEELNNSTQRPREDYLLLKVDNRLLAIPFSGISMASLPDDAILRETTEQPGQALRFKVIGGSPKEKLTMGYLERGVGWTPSYLISLVDDKTAQITMQAIVSNDAEDIENAELFFVVGVPNFAYADTLSPMSLQQSLIDFMRDARREDKKSLGAFSNAISGQAIAMDSPAAPASFQLSSLVSDMSGAPEEDLFLYNRSGVTLAKGERASYNVFSGNVEYEHLYNCEVAGLPRVDGFGNVISQNANPPDENQTDSVWHSIRLKNDTRFPWTSAPAMVISGDKPVSQDTLMYTPRGASANLNITIATDIKVSHEEREVDRQQEPEHRRGYNYDLVTVEGKLTVKSYKTKQVRLSIGKNLRGKAEFQSDEGKAIQLAEGIVSDNPNSRLTWELTLKPGQERVVTYRYKVWVRA
jgi:hypothetical protein